MIQPTSPSVLPMSRFHADVQASFATRARDLLLLPNLQEAVREKEPLELYLMVKELGLDEGLALVHCASREQLRYLIDLDCWSEDSFSPPELDAWLAAFLPLGPKALAEAFFRIDEEVQVIFLSAICFVYDLRSEEVEMEKDGETATTLDGFYLVEARVTEHEVPPLHLIDALYRHDMHEAFRLLTAAKWEMAAALEEQALHFRTARVEEMGFVSRARAMQLYSRPPALLPTGPVASVVEAEGLLQAARGMGLPALYAGPLRDPGSIFGRAMAHVFDRRRLEGIEGELVRLVGLAVVAHGSGPKDLEALGRAAATVHDTLCLALEYESDGDSTPATTATRILSEPLEVLFRRGHAHIAPLVLRARTLARDPVVETWLASPLSADDDPERADRFFLRALIAQPPAWAGQDVLRAEKKKAWRRPDDVLRTATQLEALAARLL